MCVVPERRARGDDSREEIRRTAVDRRVLQFAYVGQYVSLTIFATRTRRLPQKSRIADANSGKRVRQLGLVVVRLGYRSIVITRAMRVPLVGKRREKLCAPPDRDLRSSMPNFHDSRISNFYICTDAPVRRHCSFLFAGVNNKYLIVTHGRRHLNIIIIIIIVNCSSSNPVRQSGRFEYNRQRTKICSTSYVYNAWALQICFIDENFA